MVGVDGSENSRQALSWAARLGGELDAELLAVHAVGLLEHLGASGQRSVPPSHRDSVLRRFLEDWCAPLDAVDGLRARRIAEEGPPAMALLRLAEREHVDLIVVGCRGIGGPDEFFLGSTSSQLIHHSPVPVTVIPRAGSDTTTPG